MRTLVLLSLLVAGSAYADDKAAKTETTTEKTETKTTKSKKGLMDINSASADDLKTLPGVDDALAGKIIAGRPYTGKDQLLKQNIVDKDEYAKIRPLIHAKQPKAIGGQGAPEQHTMPGPDTGTKPAK
jgi:competence protein ComEA